MIANNEREFLKPFSNSYNFVFLEFKILSSHLIFFFFLSRTNHDEGIRRYQFILQNMTSESLRSGEPGPEKAHFNLLGASSSNA